ncbi:hypothetical protein C4J93_1968 [Pseudomonas sp. R2-37-08W]|nr:hypothetical protein C4J93_1968 [Pseudomonas sp. R2-37-08W]AZF20670.1 hypothetical protein C4J91_1919 [Pseudomonas sp. R3-52-08]AZF25999.1 hypothetical protein C4J90_1825 [Pseudomonas sp. R2-60-08W]AZF47229.1 hypothetical protein C4J86_1993 [Pseudomonas sp. R2-7-07]AZF57779.1 hypothetical protein C4J84_1901 [Pseudomonas sp. R11-23-07]
MLPQPCQRWMNRGAGLHQQAFAVWQSDGNRFLDVLKTSN